MNEKIINTSATEAGLNNSSAEWIFRLYIAGNTTRSSTALASLNDICNNELKGICSLEIVDLLKNPERGSDDQILAIPTLVRKHPKPELKLIGDLSEKQKVLSKFGLPNKF